MAFPASRTAASIFTSDLIALPSLENPIRLHVAVAVIQGDDDRVLLSRRPDHLHQGGLWEFPGGKVEAGESVIQALARELWEELGITPSMFRPLIRVHHDYGDRAVLLDVWRVGRYQGAPRGREGQVTEWVSVAQLSQRNFPPANAPVIKALQLPSCYLITPEPGDPGRFLGRLQRAIDQGVTLVQLRAKTLDDKAYGDLARQVIPLCRSSGARVLLNGATALAMDLGADGVHLDSRRLRLARAGDLPRGLLLAASCHDCEEVRQANRLGVDFMVASPVLPTRSHPQARPLGWEGFRTLSELALAPVYALGGMTRMHLKQAYAHGAQGIAGIRTFWGEKD